MRRPPWALFAAIAGLAAVGSAAMITRPVSRPGAELQTLAGGGSAGTVRISLVCPDLRTLPGTLSTVIGVGAGRPAPGDVRLVPAAGGALGPTAPLLTGGQHVAAYQGPLTGPLALQAQGPVTASLVAEQLSRGNKTTDRGWSEARCEPPRAEQWFVGAATQAGDDPQLVLANPADTQAVTDVSVLTPAGTSDTNTGHNIALAPHTVTRLRLSTLAPDVPVTAVHVTTTTGQVSAAVRDVKSSGQTPLGTDWVPVSSPAASLTVPGIPGTVIGQPPKRTLFVADPAQTDATVRVEVTGPRGTFVPSGLDSVPIPAGTVRSLDISGPLAAGAGAVTVTSDDPAVHVLAGVLVDAASTKGTKIHEITYLGPARPLGGPALIPLIRTSGDADSLLLLSAPHDPVRATLVVDSRTGAQVSRPVTIAAGSTYQVSLRSLNLKDDSTLTVVPDADSPPLYGARLIVEDGALGPLLSAFTLLGAPPLQRVPVVMELPAGAGRVRS